MHPAELALKSPTKPNKELLSSSIGSATSITSEEGSGILASMISHATEVYQNIAGSWKQCVSLNGFPHIIYYCMLSISFHRSLSETVKPGWDMNKFLANSVC